MKIIFICTGNTCRSPMAEGYLKSAGIPGLTVESRGLYADGSAVSLNSVRAMKEIGIDISRHISVQLKDSDLDADLFVCMSASHKNALMSVISDKDRAAVLGGGISDPYGGDIDTYRNCRNEIINAVDNMLLNGAFTPFGVKCFSESDATEIEKLEKECFSQPWSADAVLESYKAGTHFFTVLENGRIIGYAGISTVLDEGYITNVAVTEASRGKGAASLLMHRLDILAREKQLSFISLEVRAGNSKAQSLYNRFGYSREGLRRGFYKNPDEDAIILTKRYEYNENFKY